MNRKRERLIWISATAALALVLAVVLLSPVASAQTNNRRNTQDYMRDLEAALYILQNNYVDDVDPDILFKGAMDGMFSNLDDPYSLYLDDEFLEQMTDTTEGKYGGVGLYISKDRFDPENPFGRLPYVKVVSPIENTPSWRVGIHAGDYIFAIEDESAEGFTTQDVSNRLRGAPGTDIRVTILRDGSITFDVVLTRAEIEIPTVRSTVIDNRIGYLRIIEFTPFTEPRVKESLTEFTAQGLDKLIVDVRGNPGGLLDSVVDIADLFFSGGVIVSTQYRQERQNQVHRAAPGKVVPSNVEIVILIDKGSASASEILTGALKDRGRATIIGETSFGKGSIQQMIPLNNSAIKLTTGRYYTPDGINIDKTGIDPDIVIEEPELSEEQILAYASLLQENRVGTFVDEYPDPTASQVNLFIQKLKEEETDPGERIIRLMVKRESERRLDSPPVVDMEFDSVLIRAVEFLDIGR
jgi:carboxyl-terminal processing protease